MIKIEEAFKNKKAFIPFVLAGYPNLETTEKFILKMAEAGADLIEIGIPFSDPVAEGTVIQAASKVALSGNMTTNDIFDMAENLKGKVRSMFQRVKTNLLDGLLIYSSWEYQRKREEG